MDSWIQTYSGLRFDLLAPTIEQVSLDDIAHALNVTPRFGGHTIDPWSVLQHSILVGCIAGALSEKNPTEILRGLLHDATEAYVGDVVSPLKQHLPEYKRIEDRIGKTIALAFGLPKFSSQISVKADCLALATEAEWCFIHKPLDEWNKFFGQPLPVSILKSIHVVADIQTYKHEVTLWHELSKQPKSERQTSTGKSSITYIMDLIAASLLRSQKQS